MIMTVIVFHSLITPNAHTARTSHILSVTITYPHTVCIKYIHMLDSWILAGMPRTAQEAAAKAVAPTPKP